MLPVHPNSASVEAEFDFMFGLLDSVQGARVRNFWQGLLEPFPVGFLIGSPRDQLSRKPSDVFESWPLLVGQRSTRASYRVDVYRPALSHPAWMLSGFIAYDDAGRLRYFRRRRRVGYEAFAEVEYFEISPDSVSG